MDLPIACCRLGLLALWSAGAMGCGCYGLRVRCLGAEALAWPGSTDNVCAVPLMDRTPAARWVHGFASCSIC